MRLRKSYIKNWDNRVTGQATNVYTVISKLLKNGKEEIITVFPGLPKP
jgi:hypothetical protein